jgi:hypothetical protein
MERRTINKGKKKLCKHIETNDDDDDDDGGKKKHDER